MRPVTGTVRADGMPAEGAVVLLCTTDPARILAAADADADGGFLLEGPETLADVGLLVTLRGPIVAAGWWPLSELDGGGIELPGPFHRVELALAHPEQAPSGGEAWIEPLEFVGVSERFASLLGMRSPTVIDFRFASRALEDGRATFRAAPGTYVVGAGVPVPDGPQLEAGAPTGRVAAAARVAGVDLPRYGPNGFRVDVDGDVRIDAELRETLPGEEA